MRVALINPGNDLKQMFGRYAAAMQPVVPAGLAYLASSLRQHEHRVWIFDQYKTPETSTDLAARIAKLEPDIIGLSVLTPAANVAQTLTLELRRLLPKVKVVWGNIHAKVFADDILMSGLADAIVQQEGEETLVEYARCVQEGIEPHGVLGLSFRARDGSILHNRARPVIADLDKLPYPAYDLLDLKRYVAPPMLSWMEPILPVQASRGCPFTCHYCTQENLPKGFRGRSLEAVVDEMEFHHKKFGIRFMGFLDANFPWNRSSALEFAELYMRRGMHKKVQWITETRVDLIDDETMGALAKAGMRLIMFGFESGTQAMLDSYNKRVKLGASHTAMEAARKHNVAVLGLFMLGMPGETRESARATIDLAIELNPDFAKFNLAVPYPGSEFFERWRSDYQRTHKGPIDFNKFSSWLDKTAAGELLWVPEGMTGEELVALRDQGMRDFYLRPRFIARHMRKGTLGVTGAARGLSIFVSGWAKSEGRSLVNGLLEGARGGG